MPKMPTACSRLLILAWILSFMAKITAVRPPPMITKFSSKDLLNPDEAKFRDPDGFTLPCEASGSNISWTWKHNDTKITMFYGYPYSLSQDGTLTGSYLKAEHSGTYQCFVKDNITGIEVFSRKLQVAVTVVGEFTNTNDVVKKIDLGQPFSFQCPEHKTSFGAAFTWEGSKKIEFSRNKRRGISPDGDLYIMYVKQEDVDEIREKNGIRCKISGANSYQESGTLKLVKNNDDQLDPKILSSPSWSVTPAAEEIAIEGKSKTLYCLATGRPSPSITWKKHGQRIIDGQNSFEIPTSLLGRSLIINKVSRTMHQGRYTCEAENELSDEQPLLHTIKLLVEVAPRWTMKPPPQKMDIVVETNGTLKCQVTAVPVAPVTWYKDGLQLQSSDKHLRMSGDKLEFRDVSLNNEGVYQCTAENTYGMIASATWIHVLVWKPSFSDVQFGPFDLLHDTQGRLPCKPSAAPRPTFQWFRNGVLISYEDNSRYKLEQNGTLVIRKVDKDMDAANYTCRAENYKGADSVTAVAIVFVRPSFVRTPSNEIVKEKERATFHCTATGNPDPNITWVKDRRTLNIGQTLSFRADRLHSGRYWCVADNGLGFTIKAGADLDVQFEPSFTTKPKDQTVTEYDTVTFKCAATGNPTPQITWIKDGMPVGTANNLTFRASRSHSGKYWCSVKNGLSVGFEESASLDVQYKPENTQLAVNAANTSAIPFGSNITFNCTSHSHPDPHEYRFHRKQELLGSSATGIFHLKIEKTGLYSCIPFNDVGSGEIAKMTIVVDGTPSPPRNLQITDLDCDEWTLRLSWIPGASNGVPVEYYVIEEESSGIPVVFYFLYNVTDPYATEATLTLSGKSVPRFRMKAFNKFGASRPSLSTTEGICGTAATVEAVLERKPEDSPIYTRPWFFTVLALAAYGILFAIAAILIRKYRHGRGHKYNVKLREKKYGAVKYQEKQVKKVEIQDDNQQNEEEKNQRPFLENNNTGKGPGDRNSRPISFLSVLEENQFDEDFSFADEYKETDVVFAYETEATFV